MIYIFHEDQYPQFSDVWETEVQDVYEPTADNLNKLVEAVRKEAYSQGYHDCQMRYAGTD